ncbi:MAG: hypothetical protein E3K32_11695 [wastewater metagenome]|nr:hypothetical protein [Candidatus Loosdrechtia aerotolerans]
MHKYLYTLLIFVLLIPPCFGQVAEPEGQLLIRRYLENTGKDEMEEILTSLEGLKVRLDKMKEWITASASYPPQQVGLQRKLISLGERKGEYFVYIPSNYVPDTSWPVVMALHGVGESGYRSIMAWLRSSAHNDDFIFIAPSYGIGLWWKDEAENLVLSILERIKQDYHIDTNRIYLTGFSSGAHGTWYMAIRYPDLFAAISPIAGECPTPSLLGNLLHVPVYILHGTRDMVIPVEAARDAYARLKKLGYSVIYEELPEEKHRFPMAESEKVLHWFRSSTRSLYPKMISFSTESTRYSALYWIEITQFSELVGQVSGVQRDISGHLIRPERFPVTAAVEAQVKDADNEIHLTVQGVKEVRLYLDDRLIDMERPLSVYINGRMVFSGKINGSLRALLETVKKRNDREALFSAYVDLKVLSQ